MTDPGGMRRRWRPYALAASALGLLAATEVLVCAQVQRPPVPETARPEAREGAWLEMHDWVAHVADDAGVVASRLAA